jgi:uncharacterized membrane protein
MGFGAILWLFIGLIGFAWCSTIALGMLWTAPWLIIYTLVILALMYWRYRHNEHRRRDERARADLIATDIIRERRALAADVAEVEEWARTHPNRRHRRGVVHGPDMDTPHESPFRPWAGF